MSVDPLPWYDADVRGLLAGRRVLLAGGVAAAWTTVVERTYGWGAAEVAVLATQGAGVGPPPDCRTIVVDMPPGLSVMEQIRWDQHHLRNLPDEARTAVDAFDPDRSALVRGHFLITAPEVAGRSVLAFRRPEWVALEDKLIADDVWRGAGIPYAASMVADLDAAWARSPEVDRGAGVVWAGDATEGWHGGGALTEWVRTKTEAAAAVAALAGHCRTVRIMPFLEGVPCSIHGIVCDDGVAALRPVELVTLRQGRRLVYCGCATYYDPPPAVREEMREVARRVGALLAADVSFRGAFTVDGVATAEGFRPTELNPRAGAGLTTIARGVPDFPVFEILDLIVSGRGISCGAAELEAQLVTAADAARAGGTWRMDPDLAMDAPERRLRFDGRDWHTVDPAGSIDTGVVPERDTVVAGGGAGGAQAATAQRPPATPGGMAVAGPAFVRCTFTEWPVGPSVAPAAAAFYAWADRHLGTSIGPLTPPVQA